jgi:signal transduction histidine kinase
LAVETELDAEIPEISFDYNLIKQVLINLMLNSFDAMDKKGTVTVKTLSSNGSVLIAVEDNGAGIDEDTLKNIFNPFFTTKTRGTGLGLAISRKTMKDHGGDISVESVPGKGSTFTILLPVKK